MLKAYDTAAMIPAKDLEKTRRFYEDVLGFSVSYEDPGGIQYQSGGTSFFLYPTQFAGTAEHTLLGWTVDDIDSVVDDLASRGIEFEKYDMPGFASDERGVAETGFGQKGAWFKDPEGNILSVWQKTA
jgi:catechol 2,3-dioxygenase-like lactoylglutathione lyase family enzyme